MDRMIVFDQSFLILLDSGPYTQGPCYPLDLIWFKTFLFKMPGYNEVP